MALEITDRDEVESSFFRVVSKIDVVVWGQATHVTHVSEGNAATDTFNEKWLGELRDIVEQGEVVDGGVGARVVVIGLRGDGMK